MPIGGIPSWRNRCASLPAWPTSPVHPEAAWNGMKPRWRASQPDRLSGTLLFARGFGRQFIGAIVVLVRSVPLGPAPARGVARVLVIQHFPEIAIDHGLFRGRHPAAFFPV